MAQNTDIKPFTTFICEGTSTDWIQITGIEKVAGSWNDIFLKGDCKNYLTFTEVSYADYSCIYIGNGTNNMTISNCIIRDGSYCGISTSPNYTGTINSIGTFFFNLTVSFC